MIVLGIESSCDETAAAVVKDGRMLSNVIASQIVDHCAYGGVVPELASRKHVEAILPVIRQAIADAGLKLKDLEGIAFTRGPGLIGSLLVGMSAAKALAYGISVPFIGVNHLEGHISASLLSEKKPKYPFAALVVSGGHTNVYLVEKYNEFQLLSQTRDDAAGEAFDKAAKLLNLGYPGGVVIDRMAKAGNPKAFEFPRAMKDSPDFSFSGLKTSLLTLFKKREGKFTDQELMDVVASYQEAIVEVLVDKTIRAAGDHQLTQIVVCGGVAANSRLRQKFSEAAVRAGMELFIPPMVLCTDNAAMIAALGEILLRNGKSDALDLNAVSRWPLAARAGKT
ncbi:MAG: tRNA (adenosine(37)-N6)-threonylcarbamoyltransferase complex transferase subunit TsaD [Syntrophaceae bacterium]|nr:tRNA (adenosine(37)-N6)-threonylcarbamoyltransferase complex transferase subunit TsaD [Syntrophaceae bacterium]